MALGYCHVDSRVRQLQWSSVPACAFAAAVRRCLSVFLPFSHPLLHRSLFFFCFISFFITHYQLRFGLWRKCVPVCKGMLYSVFCLLPLYERFVFLALCCLLCSVLYYDPQQVCTSVVAATFLKTYFHLKMFFPQKIF